MVRCICLFSLLSMLWLFSSCKMTENERLEILLNQWNGKEIIFPENLKFRNYGNDQSPIDYQKNGYKIVHYVDSIGCTTCKLDLEKWKKFICYIDSVTECTVPCLFYIHTKQKREVKIALKESRFEYPVCLDVENHFYKLNKFPMVPMLQTFLLDKDNKIVGMGDPVKNARVKELYLNLITGVRDKLEFEQSQTIAELSHKEMNLGNFLWKVQQDTVLTLTNKGKRPLVVYDISTSCGCTVVDYDKRPAFPNENIDLKVTFKADNPGYFKKNIIIYCNAKNSPLVFWIEGNAIK